MTPLMLAALALVAIASTGVVFTRKPENQVIVLSLQGLVLAVLFVVLQAPEVALSQLAIGAVIVPLLYLAALTRTMRRTR